MTLEVVHIVIAIGSLAASGIVAYVALLIKTEQGRVRLELATFNGKIMQGQHEIREDFNEKHAENVKGLAVHIAEDKQQFVNIQRTLTRIDGKLDDRLPARR